MIISFKFCSSPSKTLRISQPSDQSKRLLSRYRHCSMYSPHYPTGIVIGERKRHKHIKLSISLRLANIQSVAIPALYSNKKQAPPPILLNPPVCQTSIFIENLNFPHHSHSSNFWVLNDPLKKGGFHYGNNVQSTKFLTKF